jgi:hypothetical protein
MGLVGLSNHSGAPERCNGGCALRALRESQRSVESVGAGTGSSARSWVVLGGGVFHGLEPPNPFEHRIGRRAAGGKGKGRIRYRSSQLETSLHELRIRAGRAPRCRPGDAARLLRGSPARAESSPWRYGKRTLPEHRHRSECPILKSRRGGIHPPEPFPSIQSPAWSGLRQGGAPSPMHVLGGAASTPPRSE